MTPHFNQLQVLCLTDFRSDTDTVLNIPVLLKVNRSMHKSLNACSAVFRDYNRLVSEHKACILMPFQAAFVSDPTHLDRTEPEPSQVPFSRCSITTCTICHCSVHRSDSCLTTATQLSLFCMNVDCLFS